MADIYEVTVVLDAPGTGGDAEFGGDVLQAFLDAASEAVVTQDSVGDRLEAHFGVETDSATAAIDAASAISKTALATLQREVSVTGISVGRDDDREAAAA